MNILDTNSSYLYAWYDAERDMLNIGSKTPDGISKESYITSLEDPVWWERYGWAKHQRFILAIDSAEVIKSLEWFALDYGTKAHKDRFYNTRNNAHMGDQSVLSLDMKKFVIDFIEGKNTGMTITYTDSANDELIKRIAANVESRTVYPEQLLPISEIDAFNHHQVREVKINQSAVQKIRTRMNENPAEARKTLKPVVVVVNEDGSYTIIDGNTRLDAAKGVRGWVEIPVVFINYTEFGETQEVREDNYTQFGLYANRESFEVKTPNNDADYKRRINNIIVNSKLDLTNTLHVDRARDLVYSKMASIIPSRKKINGLFKSFMTDFHRNQAELTYQDNMITYSEDFFATYCWNNYGINGIASVHIRVPETANAKGIGYVMRVMKRTKAKKGAIVLHYTTKAEIYNETQEKWIEDLKETIEYGNLPIVVDVLPPFKK